MEERIVTPPLSPTERRQYLMAFGAIIGVLGILALSMPNDDTPQTQQTVPALQQDILKPQLPTFTVTPSGR